MARLNVALPSFSRTTPLPGRPAGSLLGRVVAMAALARSRRCLADLDAHLLRDVGLSPEEARREAARPAWDAPEYWLR